MKPGPKPNPAKRRSHRTTISLPNEVAALYDFEPNKSRVAEDALRLWYSLSETQRSAMFTAAHFNSRFSV